MVDVVMTDRGAFGGAERVDAAHVAQEPFAEVVKVVPFDLVALGVAGRVAPAPADGDRRVEEVRDFVVRHLVVGGGANPDTDRAREDQAAIADDIIMHPVMAGMILGLGLVVERPDLHAAGTEVGDQAFLDGHLAGASAKREAVAADVGKLAAGEGDLLRVFEGDDAVDGADRSLVRDGGGERGQPFGMAEGEPTEGEVTDLVAGFTFEGK